MQRHAIARLARTQLARRQPSRRYSPKAGDSLGRNEAGPNTEFMNDASIDPRPPWLYTYSTLLRFLVAPAGFIYAIFFHDFGSQEHVFMPPRRWLQRQKDAFFTLSPAERHLIEDKRDTTDNPAEKAV